MNVSGADNSNRATSVYKIHVALKLDGQPKPCPVKDGTVSALHINLLNAFTRKEIMFGTRMTSEEHELILMLLLYFYIRRNLEKKKKRF